MTDEGSPTPRKGPKQDHADDEQSAELSRAAREAVRQPPDPRLEKSFAKLGLWSEAPSDAAPDAPARHGDAPSPPSPAAPDHEDLRSALSDVRSAVEELRAAVDAVGSRVELATRLGYVAVGLLALIVVLSILLLLRPAG
jgi:hypothetical protein